tara:strand:- start:64 stop:675 length:612 start_codon:yes stop_codon:yes gene_type:complete
MANQLDNGSIEDLKVGETLLMNAKKVGGDKIQLQFAEIVQSTEREISALTVLNKSDDRFSSRARRAWVTAEPSDAGKIFNINFGDDNENWELTDKGEIMELNILNPMFETTRFRLLVTETTESSEWQQDNLERAAKRKGKEGPFVMNNGNYIFSNTSTILTNEETKDKHDFLIADSTMIEVKAEDLVENAEEEEIFATDNVMS